MKVRSGIDLVKIDRIKKHLDSGNSSFFARCFTENECEYAYSHKDINKKAESFAARFALKEAAAKALGTGICTENIGFKDFEVVRTSTGSPELVFHGQAEVIAKEMGVISSSCSMSHEDGIATAVVTLLTNEE